MPGLRALAILATLLLAAPSTLAEWSYEGASEPDTPRDAFDGLMWTAPDDSPDPGVRKVYFNAFATVPVQYQGAVRAHPNLLPGMRVLPPETTFKAILGVWKDCNDDGYVGEARSALVAYREELLPQGTPCPEGSEHLRDGWVRELLWIDDSDPQRATRVWGDFGLPESPAKVRCPLHPVPHGSATSTGGLLRHADCSFDLGVGAMVALVDHDTGLGLGFDDPAHPERDCDHPLNRETPWGGDAGCFQGSTAAYERGAGDPAFTVWDCSEPKWQDVRDPTAPEGGRGDLSGSAEATQRLLGQPVHGLSFTDKEGTYASAARPAPQPRDPTGGSYYEALDDGVSGLTGCGLRGVHPPHPTAGLYPLPVDSPFGVLGLASHAAGAPTVKRQHDVRLRWAGGDDGTSIPTLPGPFAALDPTLRPALAPVESSPPYAGANPAYGAFLGWSSPEALGPPGFRGQTVRGDAQPQGAMWFTFYARLGPSVRPLVDLPPTPAPPYGEAACPRGFDDYVGPTGWDCEPSHWWDEDYGVPQSTRIEVPVGALYDLRDVDCYDGTVAQDAPKASLADASEEGVCPDA
ncbi:MAG TPA: hypothetical protein VHH36_06155, partial [Candidatus Thermoplasmatota archaeon]|nr:hypothetical protein [Candidatus Thermoplasmatota archaeon]